MSLNPLFSPLSVARATLVTIAVTIAALLISLASFDVWSQAGGMQGYDKNIKAIEPSSVSYSVGLAGDMAPTISRLILAESQGVRNSKLSPKGKYVAYISSVSSDGKCSRCRRQLWQPTGLPHWKLPLLC